jgi:ribosomal protein L22
MSKVNYAKCTQIAETIVAAYHKGTLPVSVVDEAQLKEWITNQFSRLQVKENVIHTDVVGDIVSKIRYYQHINFADPILVVKRLAGDLFLVNGNHTATALEQVIRQALVVGVTKAPIAIIPDDMLPSDPAELKETLHLVATMMNRQPKVVRGMGKADIRRMIANDDHDGIDVHNLEYQKAKANSAHVPLSTIREIVSKVAEKNLATSLNKKFHFKQLTTSELNKVKEDRTTRKNFVQHAKVSKDIAGTFAGVIDHMVTHKGTKCVHVVFHFKNYEDINALKIPTQEYMENFKALVNFPVTYEFLDDQQFLFHDEETADLAAFFAKS